MAKAGNIFVRGTQHNEILNIIMVGEGEGKGEGGGGG